MGTMEHYLDYQAARPVDPRVVEAMLPYLTDSFANPASIYTSGEEALKVLNTSRERIAGLIQAEANEIIFTSGATESNNLALLGYARRQQSLGRHIIISDVEHISILNLAKQLTKSGFDVTPIPVDSRGVVSIEAIENSLRKDTLLVSVQYANNEMGTIQPVAEIGRICRERSIAFHSDAVAAEGLLPIDVGRDHIDLLSLSSNDIYGPKGVGALYIRKGIKVKPQMIGGGQERGLRSGSENVPGIAGMAAAAEIMNREIFTEGERLQGLRDRLIREILDTIPDSHLNGHPENRLANNVNIRFDGIEGEAMLLSLKMKGIAAATGSACSSKTLEPSHTLIAMGLQHEQAHGSLGLTLGRFSRDEDVAAVLETLPAIVERLRRMSPLYA
jgi:cysteine desulfurase